MRFPHRSGFLVLLAAAAACASGTARPRGELLTVAELRARQGQSASPDSTMQRPAPAPAPTAAGTVPSAPVSDIASAHSEDAADREAQPPAAAPPAPARPGRRFPRPRWIQVQDPNPPVIPFVLFEDPIVDVMRSLSEAVHVNIVLDQDTVVRG
jgi:hypothetical protein